MGALVGAYVVVWLAVVLYVARLGAEQQRLARRLTAIELSAAEAEGRQPRAGSIDG